MSARSVSVAGQVMNSHRGEWLMRDRYESALRDFVGAEMAGEVGLPGAGRGDEHKAVTRGVWQDRFAAAFQRYVDAVDLGRSGLDVADAGVDVAVPEQVGVLRVEFEHGTVVVKLHRHETSPSIGAADVASSAVTDPIVGETPGAAPTGVGVMGAGAGAFPSPRPGILRFFRRRSSAGLGSPAPHDWPGVTGDGA